MDITLGQRELLIEMLDCEYVLPNDYKACVKAAIKQYSTMNYTDDKIDSMVEKPLSLAGSIPSLGATRVDDLSLFRGKLVEWLQCIEYNALKNRGNVVMTIVNPDHSSKADLLHIIRTKNEYRCVPGPDVKCGNANYVFNQWKKIVTTRAEIPMIDVDGILTDEEAFKKLHPRLWRQFQQLKQDFPGKKPLPSVWDNQSINRVLMDYLRYKGDDVTPSTSGDMPLPQDFAKKENCDRIKAKVRASSEEKKPQVGWDVFCERARELPNVPEDYLNPNSREKQRQKELKKQAAEALKKEQAVRRMPQNIPKKHGWFHEFAEGANQFAANLGFSSFGQMALEVTKEIGDGLRYAAPIILELLSQRADEARTIKREQDYQLNKNTQVETTREATTHASPVEHEVGEHEQTYHTKEGPIKRTIQPYRRGGKD